MKRSYFNTFAARQPYGSPANRRIRERAAKRRRKVPSTRAMVVPGYTRTVGSYARSLPNSVEKKYFNTTISNTGNMNAGVVLDSMLLIPQGTTDKKRIGNKINVTNINMKGAFSLDDQTTGIPYSGLIRVILFIDKQANGVTAAVLDILEAAEIYSWRNMDQVDRFQILRDKVYTVPCNVANALHTGPNLKPWKMSWKGNIPIHYASTTGAMTEIKSNNVGLLYVTDGAFVNVSAGSARVKFTDL